MAQETRRTRFRAVLAGDEVVRPASVFDPLSALIAEDIGFELGLFAGSMAALAVLGAPDIILLTLSELAEQARRICRAGALPVLVDADHGYGNALNVRRAVEELEAAGIAAISIEDTELPRPFGEQAVRLISINEGVGKMRAAVEARHDIDTVIAARTNVAAVELAEAVERSRAYAQTGVDALFLTGVKQRFELDAIASATSLPIILGTTKTELADTDYLKVRNVRLALQGHATPLSMYLALYEAMKAQRNGGASATDDKSRAQDLVSRLSREGAYRELASRYLG